MTTAAAEHAARKIARWVRCGLRDRESVHVALAVADPPLGYDDFLTLAVGYDNLRTATMPRRPPPVPPTIAAAEGPSGLWPADGGTGERRREQENQ